MKINDSSGEDFILVSFSEYPQAELILSLFISGFYSMTFTGNVAIILVSLLDSQLHTPMYFFLQNLSFLDMCSTTCIVPQMLVNMWGSSKKISYVGCRVQYSVALALGSTECVLLAVMAVARYVAICWPLRYATIMQQQICHLPAAMFWFWGFAKSLLQSSLAIVLLLCGHHRVDQFFCEMLVIIKLSCVDTGPTESKMLIALLIIIAIPGCIILNPYACITRAVLRMRSAEGQPKAFGTCASNLVVVSLFYGTIMFMYFQPKSNYSQNQGKVLTVVYTIVAPVGDQDLATLKSIALPWLFSLRTFDLPH